MLIAELFVDSVLIISLCIFSVVLINYIYYEDGNEMIIDDQELIAEEYGVKVIGCEYSEPIENSFN